ncbi:MAG: hypothetical protein D6767_10190 [Candidatus Hydrogenedentota bacterium]|nr:MAG: hypothetical protein D6767_10190 [Candidatus Hydrogenedentota bacterium]
MSYRAKRLLVLWTVRITLWTAISFLYIHLAHRKALPAVFEYYTGDFVRKHTATFYRSMLGRESESLVLPKDRKKGRWFWNTLDFLTREPQYLEVSQKANYLQKLVEQLPETYKADLESLANSPPILQFIKKPKSRFAQVYQYEIIRLVEANPVIDSFAILDSAGKVLFSKGQDLSLSNFPKKSVLSSSGFKLPIEDEGSLGFFVGSWNFFKAPEIQSTLERSQSFVLDKDFHIVEGNVPKDLNQLVHGNVYDGPLEGHRLGFRFTSLALSNHWIVFYWARESIFFYIYRLLLGIFLLAVLVAFLYYAKKTWYWIQDKKRKIQPRWTKQALQQALELEKETLTVLEENTALSLKQRENLTSTLNALRHTLEKVVQFQIPAPKREENQEKGETVEESTEAEDDLPLPTESEPLSTVETFDEEVREESLPQEAPIPELPDPEVIENDSGQITIIDEFTGERRIFPEESDNSQEKQKVNPSDTYVESENTQKDQEDTLRKADESEQTINVTKGRSTEAQNEKDKSGVQKAQKDIDNLSISKDSEVDFVFMSHPEEVYLEEDIHRNTLILLHSPPTEIDLSLQGLKFPGFREEDKKEVSKKKEVGKEKVEKPLFVEDEEELIDSLPDGDSSSMEGSSKEEDTDQQNQIDQENHVEQEDRTESHEGDEEPLEDDIPPPEIELPGGDEKNNQIQDAEISEDQFEVASKKQFDEAQTSSSNEVWVQDEDIPLSEIPSAEEEIEEVVREEKVKREEVELLA